MMAVFGWIVYVVIMLYFTAASALISFNTLGKYNIGGVPNTVGDKLLNLAFNAAVLGGWYGVFLSAPFTLDVK